MPRQKVSKKRLVEGETTLTKDVRCALISPKPPLVHSHGFRPNKSCHTALKYVQKYFTGTKWFVEGDIKGCFDNVDHHVLIGILRKRIADEHFIGLLWKFLKAGYMENWYITKLTPAHRKGQLSVPFWQTSTLMNWTVIWLNTQRALTVGATVKSIQRSKRNWIFAVGKRSDSIETKIR